MSNFSVLILTYNEEKNLPGCLESLKNCDDIVVLDSLSVDQTETLVKRAGGSFFQRKFDNYASQRSFGINELNFKYPWILLIDADERITEELFVEIEIALSSVEDDVSLFRFRRKDYFMGKWIPKSSGYPTWFGRLIRKGKVKIKNVVSEEYIAYGKVLFLQKHLLHFPFNRGISHWLDRHNHYSSLAASTIICNPDFTNDIRLIWSKDPAQRRKITKSIIYRLPGRPVLIFFGLYFIRCGFLEGRAGLYFCLLRAVYEFLIDCKKHEILREKVELSM